MTYPFKTHQFNIPAEKAEIYTPTRQELIFSATVCNQGTEDANISLWTRISGIESPVEFERTVPGTNTAGNKAIAVALESIILQASDAVLASSGSIAIASADNWADAYENTWANAYENTWADTYSGTNVNGGSNGSPSQLTLTISILSS